MNNPWINIQAQSIHPDDAYYVLKHNREVAKRSPAQTVRSYLPPSPYQGDPRTARVILLAKNPSFEETDEQDAAEYPAIEEENRKAMTFESDCPFYYLDSRFKTTAGYRWWANTLESVLEAGAERGVDRHNLLERMACVQYHPYRSEKSFEPKEPFPTQSYTFHLVNQATRVPDTLFVLLCGAANERLWRVAIPELPLACVRLKNPQQTKLSPGNMSAADWELLINRLCSGSEL